MIESPGWRLSATPGLSLEVAGAEIRRLKSESTKHDAPRRAAQLMSGHEIAHLGPEDGAPIGIVSTLDPPAFWPIRADPSCGFSAGDYVPSRMA